MGILLIHDDARRALLSLKENSVHCVVTSPPYYGQRDYGLPPLIWGGQESCEHEWSSCGDLVKRFGRQEGAHEKQLSNRGTAWTLNTGELCSRCGAWRGSLGLEPTAEMYLQHLLEIMDALKRVLREDGTLWLNINDTYVGSNNGACDYRPPGSSLSKHDEKYGSHKPGSGFGLSPKNMMGIPWRLAIAMQERGWILRSDIIWHKPNPMPESVRDRPTRSYEHLFLFSKSRSYFYDRFAIMNRHRVGGSLMGDILITCEEKGKEERDAERGKGKEGMSNRRDVWIVPIVSNPFLCWLGERMGEGWLHEMVWEYLGDLRWSDDVWHIAKATNEMGLHFATFPEELIKPCILAGTSTYGVCELCGSPYGRREHYGHWEKTCSCKTEGVVPATVLDPFSGIGTTGVVAMRLGRSYIGIELNQAYHEVAMRRLKPSCNTKEVPHVG